MIGYGRDPGTGIPEATVALDPASLTRSDRVDIAVPRDGGSTRLSYRATGGKPSMANGKPRVIRLLVDDDKEGDDCSVEAGYPAFVETRFNFIREGLCGNDPSDACIAALERSCGTSPDAACVTRSRPMLKRLR